MNTPTPHPSTGPRSTTTLAEAWAQLRVKALGLIADARRAPALLRPETVAQAHADHDRALGFLRYWIGQRRS